MALARKLKAISVDVVDCSAGGLMTSRLDVKLGYLVRTPRRVRREAGITTQAWVSSSTRNKPNRSCRAALRTWLLIAREALVDPHWAGRAAVESKATRDGPWPAQYGSWLERRAAAMRKF